jgi:hypothetical protein
LLNDEILRPEEIGTQDDVFLQSHSVPDTESIYAIDPETSLSRLNRNSA